MKMQTGLAPEVGVVEWLGTLNDSASSCTNPELIMTPDQLSNCWTPEGALLLL